MYIVIFINCSQFITWLLVNSQIFILWDHVRVLLEDRVFEAFLFFLGRFDSAGCQLVGSVMLLAVNAKSWLLLEGLLASINSALVGIEFGVSINVLHHVLALREATTAYETLESLNRFVNINEVPFQAVKRRKCPVAVVVEALYAFWLQTLTLKHCLELGLNLSLGFSS